MADSEIVVHGFTGDWGLPSTGPFVLKLLAWLDLNGVPYRLEEENRSSRSPSRKIPFARIGGEVVSDSQRIIERVARDRGIALPVADPAAHAARMMCEEHLHQILEYELFLSPPGRAWLTGFARRIGGPAAALVVPPMLVRHYRAQLFARGLTRMSEAEIAAQGRADLDAVAGLVAERGFLDGERPGLQDAACWGQIGLMLAWDLDTPVAAHAKSLGPLVDWAARIDAARARASAAERAA